MQFSRGSSDNLGDSFAYMRKTQAADVRCVRENVESPAPIWHGRGPETTGLSLIGKAYSRLAHLFLVRSLSE